MMDKIVLIVVVGLLAYFRSGSTIRHSDAHSGSESVWLNDLTVKFQTEKRIFGDQFLPDELVFHIRRGSGGITLKLKRNFEIDPNADIYIVQRNIDGQTILAKTTTLEREAVAYYQDVDNGAYMTVRCINGLNQQCERIISGNIQIGDRSYDLRPARTEDTPTNILEDTDSISRRYILQDQTRVQQENLVKHNEASNINETQFRWELKAPFRRFTRQEKHNYYHLPDDMLSSPNLLDLQDRGTPDKIRQLKQNYYVKVAVLIDSGVYNLYFSKVKDVHPSRKKEEVSRRIKEAYSHIMNGVSLRYKTINDSEISISVILTDFIFFQDDALFPHNRSMVTTEHGRKYIKAILYLYDLSDWDKAKGVKRVPEFDHAMLFTTHNLFKGSSTDNCIDGMSKMKGVCDPGKRTSVIQSRHYHGTVQTAAHELGHNLGADHDGEGEATSCKPEDFYLMTAVFPKISKDKPYVKNVWTFSNCSVQAFKKTLKDKECVNHNGSVYDIDEYTKSMYKQAGDVFTPQEQCSLIYGPGSVYYGTESEDICYVLRCTVPATGGKRKHYIYAARGTKCGHNKWCIEGRCVLKTS